MDDEIAEEPWYPEVAENLDAGTTNSKSSLANSEQSQPEEGDPEVQAI